MDYFVYMLFDSIKNCPIYIGATRDIKSRFSQHMSKTLKDYQGKDNVVIEILDLATGDNIAILEQYWFFQMKSWGFNLLQKKCRLYNSPKVIKYSTSEIGKLAEAFGKTFITMYRWIEKDDPRLTSDKAKKALKKVKSRRHEPTQDPHSPR